MTDDELQAIETRHAALPDVWDYTTVPSPEALAQLHADHGNVLAEVRRLKSLEKAARYWSKLHWKNIPEERNSKFFQGALHGAVRALDK